MSKQISNKKITIILSIIAILIFAISILLIKLYDQRRYPLYYSDIIIKYSEEYEQDPIFVSAIINTESRFAKDAVSNKGAIGLMQIMPDTGAWIAGKLGIKSFDKKMLYDPEMNIRLGCWYLNYLEEKFDEEKKCIMAAYNGGPGNVTKWLGDKKYSSDGKTLHTIPFKETDNYVIRVNKAYEQYEKRYANILNKNAKDISYNNEENNLFNNGMPSNIGLRLFR